jgi:hypothetical protein
MTDYCVVCGMPLNNKEDIGAKIEPGLICKYCTKEDGSIKSCDEIFNGGVHFFMNAVSGVDKVMAEKVVRKNMNRLPYWRNSVDSCLKGEQATDKEFQELLRKLHK